MSQHVEGKARKQGGQGDKLGQLATRPQLVSQAAPTNGLSELCHLESRGPGLHTSPESHISQPLDTVVRKVTPNCLALPTR